MSRVRNEQVCEAWALGKKATSGRMHTDGSSLWSYNLKIGKRRCRYGTDELVLIDHKDTSGTTTMHVNLARDFATTIEAP